MPVCDLVISPSSTINAMAEEKHCFVIEIKVNEENSAANSKRLAFLLVKYLIFMLFGVRSFLAKCGEMMEKHHQYNTTL